MIRTLLLIVAVLAFASPVTAQYQVGTRVVILDAPMTLFEYSPDIVSEFADRWYAIDFISKGAPVHTVGVSLTITQVGDGCDTVWRVRRPGDDSEGSPLANGEGTFRIDHAPIRHGQIETTWTAGISPCATSVSLTGVLLR